MRTYHADTKTLNDKFLLAQINLDWLELRVFR